ncbi:family 65 glycosyl hydrolase [Bacillus canaveralius]|uniref:Family 65 glycosyl hydrolase n=1 Tax=Bacillus canaveralius TaxID=1403243 RepID=A0A2N5GSU2_9BACI|nr:glycoside hydrolase family 65 protein [Bacillus canaveralius]PLR86840.1 family 65 glycosyl hydrolase [Bacillus canaveralius]PLR92699.1 family 65 glycosyl hydrolase [Bacillus canaveralius]RSK43092.1 glycoside hydrolase family 65 protein [Bacillus canaveralius]
MKRLFEINSWKIIETELHKENFRLAESVMSLGNGHMGMRGNFEESFSGDHHQGSYIAGVWFPDKTRVGWWKNGYPEYFGKVINSTNFIGIRLFLDGEEVDLNKAKIKEYYRELDMQHGVLTRTFTVVDNGKETLVETVRFLSVAEPELAVIRYSVTALNYEGSMKLIPYLDGDVRNEDANYDEDFWIEISKDVQDFQGHLVMKTKDNPFGTPTFQVAVAMKLAVQGEMTKMVANMDTEYVDNVIEARAAQGKTIHVYKYVAVTTDRDHEAANLVHKGQMILEHSYQKGFDGLLEEHRQEWLKRWSRADVEISGDDEAQQGIRFNLFQLFSTYYGEDSRLNIGPKGFTGEKYGGATYWDTEAYAIPLYLSTADASVARNLCIYRHNQLDGAYGNARKQGIKGALYPMVTFNGIECHNEWEITFEEIHRNGAIAYAIYNYVNYTGDREYLQEFGVDVLIGIARFWADRVHFNKKKQLYMIHGVTGPNEYENNINNNWYTNRIAMWTLSYALEVIDFLRKNSHLAKLQELNISETEMLEWKHIAANMYLPYDEELDVFVQHDTFLDKDLMTVDQLEPSDRPINQNWSWDKILRSCFIKQADVLQGLYFLNHEFSNEEKRRNFEFYEPMTVHESSLSPSIHAVLAAELGMEKKAYEMYNRTARLDLDNYNNDTEDGLHITSMTGSWLAIVQGFAGMRTANETLSFAPFIPNAWDRYSFNIIYRSHEIKVEVTKDEVIISQRGSELQLSLYGEPKTIFANGKLNVPLNGKGGRHE